MLFKHVSDAEKKACYFETFLDTASLIFLRGPPGSQCSDIEVISFTIY